MFESSRTNNKWALSLFEWADYEKIDPWSQRDAVMLLSSCKVHSVIHPWS